MFDIYIRYNTRSKVKQIVHSLRCDVDLSRESERPLDESCMKRNRRDLDRYEGTIVSLQ